MAPSTQSVIRLFLADQYIGTDKDQHASKYHLQRLTGQPGGDPAPDEDAGDTAEEQRANQGEVYVALRHVGEANDQREHGGVGDVRPDYHGWGYRVEEEEYDRHDAPRAYRGEAHEVAAHSTEDDRVGPAP